MAADEYVLGRGERETFRLMLQHQIYGSITRRIFEAAGIGAGMKVLDIGSGAGDVALLLAELVGPGGCVVGVDMNGTILETARLRADAAGWRNITFRAGDARELGLETDFDAAVGRWVLMHVREPAALIRAVAGLLKPGGIVAFHESDFTYPPTTFPPIPLDEQFRRWSLPPQGSPGPEMQMGTKLFGTFLDAGLPAPQLRLEAPIGGGMDWPGYEYAAETLRSILPAMQRIIGLDPDEVDIDTLAARLRAEVVAARGVQMLPITVGAWSRKR